MFVLFYAWSCRRNYTHFYLPFRKFNGGGLKTVNTKVVKPGQRVVPGLFWSAFNETCRESLLLRWFSPGLPFLADTKMMIGFFLRKFFSGFLTGLSVLDPDREKVIFS